MMKISAWEKVEAKMKSIGAIFFLFFFLLSYSPPVPPVFLIMFSAICLMFCLVPKLSLLLNR